MIRRFELLICVLIGLSITSMTTHAASFGSSVYQSNYLSATWNEAEAECEAHGGHLVTISSPEENSFVSSLCNVGEPFWIGATDDYGFSWVTGEDVVYTEPYDVGEPSAAAKYVAINNNGYWTNLLDRSIRYICEWDVTYSLPKPNNQVTVRVNGKELKNAQPPVIINNSTFVPLRAISEAVGFKVEWDEEYQTIDIVDVKKGGGATTFQIGNTAVISGGGVSYAPVAPFIINDTTMVPFRYIGEMYGEVLWDEYSGTADIFTLY